MAGPGKDELCDFSGSLGSFMISSYAERMGLSPIPVGSGEAVGLNPGFIVEQLIGQKCK